MPRSPAPTGASPGCSFIRRSRTRRTAARSLRTSVLTYMSKEKYIKNISEDAICGLIKVIQQPEKIVFKDGKKFIFTKMVEEIIVGATSVITNYEAKMLKTDFGLKNYIGKKYLLNQNTYPCDVEKVTFHLSEEVQNLFETNTKKMGKELNDYLLHIVDIVFDLDITLPNEVVDYVTEKYGINTDIYQGGEMWFIIQMLRKKYDEEYDPII